MLRLFSCLLLTACWLLAEPADSIYTARYVVTMNAQHDLIEPVQFLSGANCRSNPVAQLTVVHALEGAPHYTPRHAHRTQQRRHLSLDLLPEGELRLRARPSRRRHQNGAAGRSARTKQ